MTIERSSNTNLRALKVLVSCIKHGSISAAARELGMSQSAASRTMHNFEIALGLELFCRTSERVTATADGLLVANWATPVLAADAQFNAAITALSGGKRRSVRIVATQTTAETLVPKWLAELKRRDSRIDSTISIVAPLSVESAVRAGKSDIGFAALLDPPHSLSSALVFRDRLCIVTLPTHKWAQGLATIDVVELEHTPVVARDATSGILKFFERLTGGTSTLATPTLSFTSNSAVKVAVRAGIGPALISRLAVGEEIESGDFREIAISGTRLEFGIYAVWDGSNSRSDLLDQLVQVACAESQHGLP